MSNSEPPNPDGADPESPEPDPESGSLRLSRWGSPPGEKPKGRSAMPSTVLMTGGSCGRPGHAVGEPEDDGRPSTLGGVNRRILTLLVALVPIVAFGVLLAAVTVPYVSLGPGPTFDTLGQVDGKEVVDIKGTEVHPTTGHLNMTTVSQRDDLTLGQALSLWMSGREH